MPKTPKSFREFALDCKAGQRRHIREERERMQKARVIWEQATLEFRRLGLPLLTDRDISDRQDAIDKMEAEIDIEFGDNETMRASYAAYLRSQARE